MYRLRSRTFLVAVASLVLVLSSCSSSDSGQAPEIGDDVVDANDSGQMSVNEEDDVNSSDPSQTAGSGEDTIENMSPNPAPVLVSSRTPFQLISQLPSDDTVFTDVRSAIPFAVSDDGSRTLVKASYFNDNDTFVRQFVTYDVSTDNATPLAFTPVTDAFPAFDMTWKTMAYANGCDATIQNHVSSEAISLGSLHGLDALCANGESAQISDDGETVLMPTSRIDDGINVPVIFGISSGTVITLDSEFLQQADSALAGRMSTAYDPSLSADGRYVVATVIVSNEPIVIGQDISFSAGTVIVDTRTTESRVIGLSDYQRFNCQNCSFVPVSAPAISGNGRYVVYEQAPEIQVPGEEPVSNTTLIRYDINTEVTEQLRAGTRGTSEIVVSDNGARVAWRVGADVQIAYVGSDEIVSLQDGFKFCTDGSNDCLFATARFITSTTIQMSGDGSALTVYLIPQQGEGASALDRPELLHFNLDTGTLSRVAPGASESFHAISHDGRTVALVAVDQRGVETVAVFRADGDDG